MKKTFIFVLLLLSLFAYKANAAPNTGTLPENSVKVNFNANGTYNSVEGSGWAFNQQSGSLTLTKGEVVITLNEYVFKDGEEIIGFSWMIEGATAVLWVKHGTTQEEYGNGTSGEFVTSDSKGVSNAVFLIEIIDDEEEIDDEEQDDEDEELDEELDEEEQDDEEDEEVDEEEVVDEEEEVVDEEEELDDEEDEIVEQEEQDDEEELDDEVLGEEENVDEEEEEVVEEENVEEDEVLGEEEESLPDTSDASRNLGLLMGLMGLILIVISKKKAIA